MFIIAIILGLAALFFGGELLVRGSVGVAERLHISRLVIGLTIVAFGTSSPELFVSVKAALDGLSNIALGNVIGSNISNILLIIGSVAVLHPLTVDQSLIKRDGLWMMFFAFVLVVFAINDPQLQRVEGGALLLLIVIYTVTSLWFAKRERAARKANNAPHVDLIDVAEEALEQVEESDVVHLPGWKLAAMVLGGLLLLILGSDWLVYGAVTLAKMLGISDAVIAVTIVAVGSSAPELATCVVAAYRKQSDLALGNIVGSNIYNIGAILGVAILASPLSVSQQFAEYDIWVMLGVTFALYMIMRYVRSIPRPVGALFLLGYVAYLYSQYKLVGTLGQ